MITDSLCYSYMLRPQAFILCATLIVVFFIVKVKRSREEVQEAKTEKEEEQWEMVRKRV